jgi:hypothetical protein
MKLSYAERHRFDKAAPFKIDGVYCKLIPLTKGQYAIVWESDYEWLMFWNWCARWNGHPKTYYAVRGVQKDDRQQLIYMHRFIKGLAPGDLLQCDHKSPGSGLDCRRSNLRIASNAQNHWNQGVRKNNKSGYKGVYLRKDTGKWTAQITVNGRCKTLGSFRSRRVAFLAYCKAAELYHGEFARVA